MTAARRHPSRLRDSGAGYGWISIALHWLGAALILAMLFIGNSIRGPRAELQQPMLRLHTTLGLGLYLLLWARVIWRLRAGHPDPGPKQARWSYAMGRWFHYVLLAAIAVMLVTGPPMAWAGGLPLTLAGWVAPAPFAPQAGLFSILLRLHVAAATVLGWGTLIHLLAVIKHTTIDRDGAFDRMMVPAPSPAPGPSDQP